MTIGKKRSLRARTQALGGFATLLLASSALSPVLADGGNGGISSGNAGGTGGTGFSGEAGNAGAAGNAGGGGGGAGGGAGGIGAGPAGGTAGGGGTSGSIDGENGGTAFAGSGGGGGGGGGFNGNAAGSPTIAVGSGQALIGGNGGNGGTGSTSGSGGAGGGGGGGGYGAIVTSGGASSNAGTISGGTGGRGGPGQFSNSAAGNGGGGGIALQFTTGGASFVNSGTVAGGTGGFVSFSVVPGSRGAGGVGIAGGDLTIINSGSIRGGLGGDGITRADAIAFTGGANSLTLQPGSTITGNIDVTGSLTLAQPVNATLSNVVSGSGSIDKTGAGTLTLSGANTYSGGTTVSAGILQGNTQSLQGAITNNAAVVFDQASAGTYAGSMSGTGNLTKQGTGTLTLTGTNTHLGGTTIASGTLAVSLDANLGDGAGTLTFNGGTLQLTGSFATNRPTMLAAGGGTIDTNGNAMAISSAIAGTGGLTKVGLGTLRLQAAGTYSGGTTVNAGTLLLDSIGGSLPVGGALLMNGGTFDMSEIAIGQTVGALSGPGGTIALGANTLTTSSPASTALAAIITGTGGLVKQGSGTLTLTGASTYSGGTTVSGGLVNFSTLANFGTGPVTLSGGGLQWAAGSTTDISPRLVLGAGGGTVDTNGNTVTLASAIGGTGGLTKQGSGLLNLTGANTYTGPTSVTAGTLAVNGSLTSNTTVAASGTLGGNGTIFGTVSNGGIVAPGNSIGTLTINGSFVQAAGGTYQVEVNAAGQGDRINVTGAPGTATINGGTVQVLAQPGNYGASTTYTIVNATGGRTGTFAGVTSNFAFLTPTLTYDPNNVFLTLALAGSNPFSSFGGITPNQKAVGWALDASFATASGDLATVFGALTGLSTVQGPLALDAISGQQYADFGTMNTNNGAMFMNAVGTQMAAARGNAATGGQRAALAQACEIAVCDPVGPLSAWISGLGGLGSVMGDGNADTLTYNFGGAAVGADYRLDPRFLLGLSAAYTSGTEWVNGFMGKGWTNSVAVAAYGSYTPSGSLAGFYTDALAGYAWFNNQLQRQIQIPGLQQRQASGSTGANQFLGQIESGYKLGVYAPAAATVTPFGRFAVSSVTQNAFSEWGANALSLNVQRQTTNSLRSTLGAEFGSAVGLGNERVVALALRLGWQHEFAYTGRPITAAFSGAPANSFTVYGATPQPDAAVIGFSANTLVAAATQLYLRYDGELGNGTNNHALNVGVRVSW